MTVAYLADTYTVALAGRVLGAVILPVASVVLLILGVRKRRAARKQSSVENPVEYPPGYQPPPQQPKPKSGGTGFIVAGVLLLVLAAVSLVGASVVDSHKISPLAIGDCVTNGVVRYKSSWSPHSCGDVDAVLQYAANADSSGNCPDGKPSGGAYFSIEHDGARMCFAPNFLEGQCYTSEHADDSLLHESCTEKHAIKVVKRVDGSTDKSACPKHTRADTYTQPSRTYCTEKAKKG